MIEGKIHPIFTPLLLGLANLSHTMQVTINDNIISVYVDSGVIRVITAGPNGLQVHTATRQELEEAPKKEPMMDPSGPGEGENVN